MESICALVTDGTHDSPKLQPSGVPFIKGKHISQGYVDFATCDFITEVDHAEACRRVKPRAGDVLFSNIGSVGDTARVSVNREFSIKNVALFRPDPTKVDPRYFYYLVVNPRFRNSMLSLRSGSAQPFITLGSLRGYETSFHTDRDQQRRIASILSGYDDLIENCTRRIAILEEMAQRIYEEWFVRFRFPGHEGVRMVESELGLVPEGWRMRALGDLVDDIRDGVNPDAVLPETPYVGLEHIPRRSIALAEWGQAANVGSTKLRFREGDILFGKIRPYFHKVAVAPVAGVASSDAIVIRAKQAHDFGLALAVASSDAFVAHATQTSNGTKMPRANWGVLRQYPVPTPPRLLHKRFEEFMAGVVSAVANHVLRNRNLRATRDLLLPKLISGELDVSAMPDPEVLTT
jgi:type I restriction enzyme S subunit